MPQDPIPIAPTTTATGTAAVPPPASTIAQTDAPIVLDLGSRSRKQIKRLRRGEGKLMDRITTVIDQLKNSGNISATAQPIVIVVKEKPESALFGLLD